MMILNNLFPVFALIGLGSLLKHFHLTGEAFLNASDRLVWQGVAVTEANDKTAQNLRDAVYTAVNRVFELYPHTTGR